MLIHGFCHPPCELMCRSEPEGNLDHEDGEAAHGLIEGYFLGLGSWRWCAPVNCEGDRQWFLRNIIRNIIGVARRLGYDSVPPNNVCERLCDVVRWCEVKNGRFNLSSCNTV